MKRSREEWAALVAKWKGSGASLETFAEPLGIRPRTLQWWAWRLGSTSATSEPARHEDVRLLPVTVRGPFAEPQVIEVSMGNAVVRFPAATAPQTIGDVMLEIKALTC